MPINQYDIPHNARRIIRWFCDEKLHEEIEGNLIEFKSSLNPESRRSNLKFWFQVINYLRLSTMKRNSQNSKFYMMFSFNISLTLRNLLNHGRTTFLNVAGYAVGMLCVSLLYFYIKGELSYDNFHQDKDEIYRVVRVSGIDGEKYRIGVTSGLFADHLKLDFPDQIKNSVRVYPQDGLVEYGDKTFKEDKIFFSDENFFTFFSFPLSVGDPKTVLSLPNSIVLTKKSAEKYFGNVDPMGKILTIDKSYQFVVTGILDEFPAKSHLDFDFIGSLKLFKDDGIMTKWWNNGLVTYLNIESPEIAMTMQEGFPQFIDRHFGKWIEKSGKRTDIELEAFSDIYFNSDIRYDWVKHGNRQSVYLLIAVAIGILFIACFNYLNLAIALSFQRAKEVGMRKILGGNKFRLTLQFLGESLIVVIFAIFMAIGLSELSVPWFNGYFDLDVNIQWLDPNVIIFFSLLFLTTVVVSGLYPAILVSSFNPLAVLKGHVAIKKNNLLFRKVLVIAQFSISIFMIIATLITSKQLDFINNKSLGFSKEAIVLIRMDNREIYKKMDLFKDRLVEDPKILKVSSMSGEPGGFHDATTVAFAGSLEQIRTRTAFVDLDYCKTFDIKLAAGRDFSDQYYMNDMHAAMINRKAAEALSLTVEEAIGAKFRISMWDTLEHVVIGVTEDYHFSSLKDVIEPIIIVPNGRYHRTLAVKVDPANILTSLEFIEETYSNFAPNYPIAYEFMDDSLNSLYANEQKQSKIFQTFSTVSIFLACLGIFGLVSFAVERRRKEFGIRKALGAGTSVILQLVSKDFIMIIVLSSLVAIPIAYYLLNQWLQNFAYRIDLSNHLGVFLSSCVIALMLAIITIFIRTIKTAQANPTDSLRYE